MNVLILHAWLRGNLGDEILTSIVIERIKQIPGTHIRLVSIPPDKSYKCPVEKLVDQYTLQPYQSACVKFVENSDIVLIAPGGGLQKPGDDRAPYIYRDADVAIRKEKPVVLCGHSFCKESINTRVLQHSTVITREPESNRLLYQCGMSPYLSSDYAYLKEISADQKTTIDTLLFLRFDNYTNIRMGLDQKTLCLDEDTVLLPPGEIVLTSSDYERDKALLGKLSRMFNWRVQPIWETKSLLYLISKSKHVVTDRYHPAILSQLMGKVAYFLPQRICRDIGLQTYLSWPIPVLKVLASHGLDVIENAIRRKGMHYK